MSSLTIPELRQHVLHLEQHIANALNDFSSISKVTIDNIEVTPIERFGSTNPTYHIHIDVRL